MALTWCYVGCGCVEVARECRVFAVREDRPEVSGSWKLNDVETRFGWSQEETRRERPRERTLGAGRADEILSLCMIEAVGTTGMHGAHMGARGCSAGIADFCQESSVT